MKDSMSIIINGKVVGIIHKDEYDLMQEFGKRFQRTLWYTTIGIDYNVARKAIETRSYIHYTGWQYTTDLPIILC